MSKTIAIVNHSGGSGKTTTAFWLAKHLAHSGAPVTLIDADPQGDLTAMCGGMAALGGLDNVLEGRSTINATSQYSEAAGCNLVTSDDRLAQTITWMQAQKIPFTFLRNAIRRANGDRLYIVDCAPSLDAMMLNAVVAADYVIIACNAEEKAARGTERAVKYIADIDAELDRKTNIIGSVITQVVMRNDEPHIKKQFAAVGNIRDHVEVLGFVPRADGVGASEKIGGAYRCIAQKVLEAIV